MATKKSLARFIDTIMNCHPVSRIPEGPNWTYEIKLDGYRLEAVKAKGRVMVYSCRRTVLNRQVRLYCRGSRGSTR
jgi:ATP-dependent DNA ligase